LKFKGSFSFLILEGFCLWWPRGHHIFFAKNSRCSKNAERSTEQKNFGRIGFSFETKFENCKIEKQNILKLGNFAEN
jgi:hypothetical protein